MTKLTAFFTLAFFVASLSLFANEPMPTQNVGGANAPAVPGQSGMMGGDSNSPTGTGNNNTMTMGQNNGSNGGVNREPARRHRHKRKHRRHHNRHH